MILEALKKEHSKLNTLAIVNYVGSDPKRFEELLAVFSLKDIRLSQRAAWPLTCIAENQPDLIQPHLSVIVDLLDNPLHVAVKRNVMRSLRDFDLPENLLGNIADKAFVFLMDHKEAIAVRAFSMTVLYKICLKEPDLKNELIPIIEDMLQYGCSPGLKSYGKKMLKALHKI